MVTPPRLAAVAVCCLCCCGLLADRATCQEQITSLVDAKAGDLPIILSAPHGGREAIPGVSPRTGEGVARFKSKSDLNTGLLTKQLANAIEQKTGRRPYAVIARFHRRFVDANRAARNAYESTRAKSTYDAYHLELAKARREVRRRWGRGVVIDIHGQAAAPQAIFRGTQNGETTTHLLNRFGREALTGETSLFGQLSKQGFAVIPAVGSRDREHPAYDGGYTVVTYGSGSGGTVDAIQLELGRELRAKDEIPKTVSKLTEAIAAFSQVYLPEAERTADSNRSNGSSTTHQAAAGIGRTSGDKLLFSDDFSDGDRVGWYEVAADSSALSIEAKSGQLGSLPELTFIASDKSSVKSFAAHFPETRLERAGDYVTLEFDARHDAATFVDRGFRFGLFNSGGTKFSADGNFDTKTVSRDDDGCFAILDLGSSTTRDSAILRESENSRDKRLWNGATLSSDDNDEGRDPLMFTRNRSYTYTLTLTRNRAGNVDVLLKNNVSGDKRALTGTASLDHTLPLDTIYFGTHGTTGRFSIDNVCVRNTPGTARSPEAVRVGVYVDDGAGASVKDLLFALGKFEQVSITRLTADDIRSGALAELDLLIQPGGSGGGQGRHLEDGGRQAIRNFVRNGGGFIGICAGSYLASADYSWSLNILDARVVDRKHWNRGNGTVRISLTDSGQDLLSTDRQQLTIFYGQGPLLAPGQHPEIEDYEVAATFETEVAKNGAPTGVMKGTTAIASGKYGSGRVLCFSPHPELTQGLETLIQRAIDVVRR